MRKQKNWWVWIGLGLLVLFIAFKVAGREYLTESGPIFGKKGKAATCPPGSIPNNSGTCAGKCPEGEFTISNGLQCEKRDSIGNWRGRGPAPTVVPISCSPGNILMDGACYEPCPAGYNLEPMMQFRGEIGCVKSSTPIPTDQPVTLVHLV